MLKVTRGNPTAEELAAVLAVVYGSATSPDPAPAGRDARPSLWRRSGLPSQPHRPGPGAWAASARTR
jgi:hypothetical protein